MLLTQGLFFVFLAIVFLIWLPWGAVGRKVVLVGASAVFYGAWDPRFLGLLGLVWLVVLVVPQAIARNESRTRHRWLTGGVASLLLLLFWFKYYDFFLGATGPIWSLVGAASRPGALRILLPVGISFYIFQAISYLVDVHRRKVDATRSPLDAALYVTFFPLLLAGPIERGAHWMPQVAAYQPVTSRNLREGLERMLVGYCLKVGIADVLAPRTADIFLRLHVAGSGELWAGAFAYTVQILADFAGYSLIARGVSKLFGYEVVANFEQPYFSRSFSEFWRCWHISLSSWIWDYVFNPLMSSVLRRVGRWNLPSIDQEMRIAYPVAVITTMVLCGLWHGAGYTFLVWGLLHGVFLAFERLVIYGKRPIVKRRRIRGAGDLLRAAMATGIVFTLVMLSWIVFRAPTLRDAGAYYVRMFTAGEWGVQSAFLVQLGIAAVSLLAIEAICYQQGDEWVFRKAGRLRGIAYAGVIVYLIVFGGASGEVPFIYFQF